MIVLLGMGLGSDLIKDGEPKKGKHSFVVSLIATAIMAALLYAGGFFQ